MAWRIHDHVIRGEIDNRQRGVVRGRIWLEGYDQPILLDLQGNAAPDLAGCLLQFENPGQKLPARKDARLELQQRGRAGDLTASRKVRVQEMPVAEAYRRDKQGLPVPEHMANCLYLEWFSEGNGRVVIESTDYAITISSPSWRLSPEEEQERQRQSAEGFSGFMQKLSEALEAQKHDPPADKQWDEFDYEKFMRECDARTDKYAELLDKYKDDPERDRIVAREMGWDRPDLEPSAEIDSDAEMSADPGEVISPADSSDSGDEDPFGPGESSELQPDPATEGVDWVRAEGGEVTHPLVQRVLEGSAALFQTYENLHLENTADEDLVSLLNEYQTTTAKLGGALDGLAYGRGLTEGAFIVACLKRALSHLHGAQAALEHVSAKAVLPTELVASLRTEFFAVREEILRLMQEFREQS